ncbi:uncharacterized protein [Arachis hypogaea]|uniref:uncharacterized protein n=1 Tax=Arachis hypogaea TaxID=3818 RepID=UPI003B214498
MRPKQHITAAIEKQSEQAKKNYQIHLTVTIDCIRFLLRQGLAFRGNDETDDSINQGNFLELLNFLAQHNEEIGRALKNAHGILKLIAPSIQKDIVRAAARKTTKVIVDDIGMNYLLYWLTKPATFLLRSKFSCKRRDILRDSQMTKTIEALKSGEISSGRGLNQETVLKRAGDTGWGSHYETIL